MFHQRGLRDEAAEGAGLWQSHALHVGANHAWRIVRLRRHFSFFNAVMNPQPACYDNQGKIAPTTMKLSMGAHSRLGYATKQRAKVSTPPRLSIESCQNLFHHRSINIGEPEVAPEMSRSQSGVINPKQVEHRGV